MRSGPRGYYEIKKYLGLLDITAFVQLALTVRSRGKEEELPLGAFLLYFGEEEGRPVLLMDIEDCEPYSGRYRMTECLDRRPGMNPKFKFQRVDDLSHSAKKLFVTLRCNK